MQLSVGPRFSVFIITISSKKMLMNSLKVIISELFLEIFLWKIRKNN